MPTRRSAIKRVKTDEKKRKYNVSVKSEVKTAIAKIDALAKEQKKEEAQKALPKVISLIDKAAKHGIIHKKTASRKKSRLTLRVNAAATAAAVKTA